MIALLFRQIGGHSSRFVLFCSFWRLFTRVSVQGVKSLGGHFACLCQGFDFYEVKQNKKMLSFYKNSKIAQIYYYDPQSAGIKVQSPQSDSTARRLTLQICVVFCTGRRRKLQRKVCIVFTFSSNTVQTLIFGGFLDNDNSPFFDFAPTLSLDGQITVVPVSFPI